LTAIIYQSLSKKSITTLILVNKLKKAERIYGKDVGNSIIDFLSEKESERPFVWSHEKAGFETEADKDFEYL